MLLGFLRQIVSKNKEGKENLHVVGTGERVREIVMLQKHEDLQPQSPPKAQDDITCFSPSAGRNGDKRILGALLLSQCSQNRLSDSLPQ